MALLPYILAAVLAGVFIPVQAGVNGALRRSSESPIFAALISFAGGTLALGLVLLLARVDQPKLQQVPGTPWYGFTGGLLGAFFVTVAVLAQPKIGAATLVGCMILGQVICSLAIDHFGWLEVPVREITLPRAAGALLVLGGVYLVQRG